MNILDYENQIKFYGKEDLFRDLTYVHKSNLPIEEKSARIRIILKHLETKITKIKIVPKCLNQKIMPRTKLDVIMSRKIFQIKRELNVWK